MRIQKKFITILSCFLFVIVGSTLLIPSLCQVKASEETTDVYYEQIDISKYRDMVNGHVAPKPSDEEHKDWIFAGWFYDEECTQAVGIKATSGERYAKFVPADVLNVRCQVSADTTANSSSTDLRLVSTVESNKIYRTGFKVTLIATDGTQTTLDCSECDTVYGKIVADNGGVAYNYSPNIFDLDSTYFSTVTITGIPQASFDTAFKIEPYWITKDNTTVYGVSRYARVSDCYNGIINIPVSLYSDDEITSGIVNITYDAEAFVYDSYDAGDVFTTVSLSDNSGTITCTASGENVTTADGMLVNLRFKAVNGETLKSLKPKYSFAVTGSDFENGETAVDAPNALGVTYKNFLAEYDGTNAYTDWYNTTDSEFVLTTAPELYGLASLSANHGFANQKIYIGADIVANTGNSTEWEKGNNTSGLHNWTPLGTGSYNFNGAFDGQGHTISGIYCKQTTLATGFFGITKINAKIHNLRLEDSYFESATQIGTGSIVGLGAGEYKNLYSNAIVKNVYNNTTTPLNSDDYNGGILGKASGNTTLENCWFNGSVDVTGKYCGGLVGYSDSGTLSISHCQNSGTINRSLKGYANGGIGGIVGKTNSVLVIDDCLNSGTVTSTLLKSAYDEVGAVIGSAAGSANVTITDTYYTTESCKERVSSSDSSVNTSPDGFGVNNAMTKDVDGCKSISLENLKGELASSTTLDFASYWSNVAEETPILTTYKDVNAERPILSDTSWYDIALTSKTYTITTAEEFLGLAEMTWADSPVNFGGWTIYLGEDIKFNTGSSENWSDGICIPLNSWATIGNSSANFNGTFDGQGHTISGVYCTGSSSVGLFGVTTINSVIKNFHLENSYFSNTGYYTGSIAGVLGGKVEKVHVQNDVFVKSTNDITGGIAGRVTTNDTKNIITNCDFAGIITTTGNCVGGIVANLFGNNTNACITLEHCRFSGEIRGTKADASIGGFVGQVSINGTASPVLTITDSLNVGTITNAQYNYVAHIVGRVYSTSSAIVTDTYAKETSKYSQLATWSNVSTDVQAKLVATVLSEAEMKDTSAEKNTTLDFETYWTTVSGNTPVLASFAEYAVEIPVGILVADTSWYTEALNNGQTYTITTAEELMGFAQKTSEGVNFGGWTIKLGADIKLNDGFASDWAQGKELPLNTWTVIGGNSTAKPNFGGTFDGQGYTISGVYCTGTDYIGFFGVTNVNSVIRDFHFGNSYFSNTGYYTGSIAGVLGGSVEKIHVQKDVYINTTNLIAGGIAGRVTTNNEKNIISNCEFAGKITTTSSWVGGILGNLFGNNADACVTIEHCLFSGEITGTSENAIIGGLVGDVTIGSNASPVLTITDSLTVGTITNKNYSYVAHIVGRVYNPGSATVTNTYAKESSYYSQLVTWGDGITDEIKAQLQANVLTTENLEGLSAKTNASALDFNTYWVCTSGTPALKSFADMSDNTVLTEDSLAFSYWTGKTSVSLDDAVDSGSGSAVITIKETTIDNYTEYINALNQVGITTKVANSEGLATQGVYNTILQKDEDALTINVTFVEKLATIYVSIDGKAALSPALNHITTASTSGTTKLHMMEMTLFGNSFIIELKNGHFIINDGGSEAEAEYLLTYLKRLAGNGNDIIIDAWTVSHTHHDHSYVIHGLMNLKESWGVDIRVNGFYVNLPNDVLFNYAENAGDTDLIKHTNYTLTSMKKFKGEDGNQTPIYRYQTGHRYYFDDVTMDVVMAQEQLVMDDCFNTSNTYTNYHNANDKMTADGFNETSTWLMFTIDGKKVLIAGDAGPLAMEYVMDSYNKSYFNLDVFATIHHAGNTWSEFTDFCTKNDDGEINKIEIVLVPLRGNPTEQTAWPNLEAVKTLLEERTDNWYYGGTGIHILEFTTTGITHTGPVTSIVPD